MNATVMVPRSVRWAMVTLGLLVVRAAVVAGAEPAELPPPPEAAAPAESAVVPAVPAASAGAKAAGDDAAAKGKSKPPAPPDGRCDCCGGCSCVRSVCVPKMSEKEVVKVCWSYRCEEFCIPGPSVCCGEKCGKDACGSWWHLLWKPTCAEVRTRHVPVKNEVKRKVPSVEWRVEERCEACRQGECREAGCAAR